MLVLRGLCTPMLKKYKKIYEISNNNQNRCPGGNVWACSKPSKGAMFTSTGAMGTTLQKEQGFSGWQGEVKARQASLERTAGRREGGREGEGGVTIKK